MHQEKSFIVGNGWCTFRKIAEMEVMESEAAITAIHVLQKRVKELELEQQELKEEVYALSLQLQTKDDSGCGLGTGIHDGS